MRAPVDVDVSVTSPLPLRLFYVRHIYVLMYISIYIEKVFPSDVNTRFLSDIYYFI